MTKAHSKKTHSEHTTSHKHNTKKSSGSAGLWQITTAIFLVLFVVSLATQGFSGKEQINNVDKTASAITTSLANEGLLVQGKNTQAEQTIATSLMATTDDDSHKKDAPKTTKTVDKVDKPLPIELYVMSECPYGVQAENTMFAAIKSLGEENFDLKLNYIVTDLGNGKFNSLHGQTEADGDMIQLCAKEQDETKLLDLVLCMNKNPKSIPGNWKSCAADLDYDTTAIQDCFDNGRGAELLSASGAVSSAAGASGSPTIVVGDTPYSGARGENDFKRAFCNAFEGEKPTACSDIPEPTKFDMIVLNDKRCTECSTIQSQLVGQLKGLFPGMQVQTVDYSSAEGQQLYKQTGVETLPAFLFNDDVKKTDAYTNVAQYLIPAGDYSYLRIGATFNPTKEICNNNIDDTNNGLIDCADSDCAGTIECRDEKPQQLQVFIMSDCPYGKEAVKALKEVNSNFNNLDFEIHYIASEQGDGFNSLHGTYEADEDIVQLCTHKYSPDVWFDYMYCRSVEGIKGNDWHNCATQTGVDVNAVETCVNGDEGANLLRQDIKIADGLGISASPTWLANNKYPFSGIDAETIKTNFCKYNPDTAGCENDLSSNTKSVPAGSCG